MRVNDEARNICHYSVRPPLPYETEGSNRHSLMKSLFDGLSAQGGRRVGRSALPTISPNQRLVLATRTPNYYGREGRRA